MEITKYLAHRDISKIWNVQYSVQHRAKAERVLPGILWWWFFCRLFSYLPVRPIQTQGTAGISGSFIPRYGHYCRWLKYPFPHHHFSLRGCWCFAPKETLRWQLLPLTSVSWPAFFLFRWPPLAYSPWPSLLITDLLWRFLCPSCCQRLQNYTKMMKRWTEVREGQPLEHLGWWEYGRNTSWTVWLSGRCAVHLRPIQSNVEGELLLKNKKILN